MHTLVCKHRATTIRLDEETKEALDHLQDTLRRKHGQRLSHAAVLARLLRFAREHEREFLGDEDWAPLSAAQRKALLALPVKSGVRASAKDIDKACTEYEKDGSEFILMSNSSRGVMKLPTQGLGDYDSITEGRFFPGHRGFTVALDEFDVDWHPNGVAKQFISRVRVYEDDRLVREDDIYVNSPLTYRGIRLYQISWGWAPELTVRQHGRVLYDGPTIFLPRQDAWRGVVKTPGTEPYEMGLDMLFFTDPEIDVDGTPFNAGPAPVDPLVVFEQYIGDLGLDRAQSVYELDPRRLSPAEVGALRIGDTVDLPDGIDVSFNGLRQYSVFQVASNPGAPVLLIGAILLLVSLVPALYSSRRRIWVRAEPADEGARRLEVAGLALQRKAAFAEEFRAMVREIDRDLHARIGARDG